MMSKQYLLNSSKIIGISNQDCFNSPDSQIKSGKKRFMTKDFSKENGIDSRIKKNRIKLFHVRKILYIVGLESKCRLPTIKKSFKYLRIFISRNDESRGISHLMHTWHNLRKIDFKINLKDGIIEFINILRRDCNKYAEDLTLEIKGIEQSLLDALSLPHALRKFIHLRFFTYRAYFTEYYPFDQKVIRYVSRIVANLNKLESIRWEPVIPQYYSKHMENSKEMKPIVSLNRSIKNLSYTVHLLNEQYYDWTGTWLTRLSIQGNIKYLNLTLKQFFRGSFNNSFLVKFGIAISSMNALEEIVLALITTEPSELESFIFDSLSKKTSLKTLSLKMSGFKAKEKHLPIFAEGLANLINLNSLLIDFSGMITTLGREYNEQLGRSLANLNKLNHFSLLCPFKEVSGIHKIFNLSSNMNNLFSLSIHMVLDLQEIEDWKALKKFLGEQHHLRKLSLALNSDVMNPSISLQPEQDTRSISITDQIASDIFELLNFYPNLEDLAIILGDLIPAKEDVDFSQIFDSCKLLRKLLLNFGKNFFKDKFLLEAIKKIEYQTKIKELILRGNFSSINDETFKELTEFIKRSDQFLDIEVLTAGLQRKKKHELTDIIQKIKEKKASML